MTEKHSPRVFISYSHDTVEHQERVLGLADRLRRDGIDAEIDQYNAPPPEGWPLWCERQIEAADVVLMVCTETYHRRVTGEEERGKGLGVVWEARIIRQLLYDAGVASDKFVPVLFSDASPEQIPTPIRGGTRYVVDREDGHEDLYRRLTGQLRLGRPVLGPIPLPVRRRLWSEAQAEAVSVIQKTAWKQQVRVFISYSHDTVEHEERVLGLADRLRRDGIDAEIDQYNAPPPEGWPLWCERQIEAADVVLMVCTETYHRRVTGEERGKGLGVVWEARIIRQLLYDAGVASDKFVPVLFSDASPEQIPTPIRGGTRYVVDSEDGYDDLYRRLTGQPRLLRPVLGTIRPLPARRRKWPDSPRGTEKKRPLNEGKLMLVGRGEVGKTSLVRRLANDEFRGDESKTQGINITDWLIRCERLRLHVWDFGGQEIMHATHQFFLTERSLYILVLNGREGGEDIDAEYWLKLIATFGGHSPVIVAQNKITQHPFDLNYRGLQARYPQIRGFVKTDCMDGVGIEDLRRMIWDVASSMDEIRTPFPSEWLGVKETLESVDDDFMSLAHFSEVCHAHGIMDESERDKLCWVLHCLGIALNYREDPRLRETSVLKPEWVTQGIYKILNAKTVADRLGELNVNDLKTLLPIDRYPLDKHHFLLELMRKFSLCFAFPEEPDRFLIPELLGKEDPEELEAFRPNDCLNFEYHYGILPEGLVPRFIVRSHTLSQGQERWRTGVVLAYEGCKALVIAVPAERRVIVRVVGGDAGARRRLLALIRYDLDRIHGEFQDRLEVQQKVPLTDYPVFSVDYEKLVALEKHNVAEFHEYIGHKVVMVQVNELLNGIDLPIQCEYPAEPKSIFLSYSHKDETFRDELETHLKLLERQGIISTWHDRKIFAGTEWDHEIDRRLERATIILLLISADFIASRYCCDKEVKRALERHNSGEATVIPVILRKCDWHSAPFGKLQGLPKNIKPVKSWRDRDAAWTDVATSIREIAENLGIS